MNKLQYQPLNICHADAMLHIWSDADVIQYTNMKLPCTLEDATNRIVRFQAFDVFAVIHDGEVIGIAGCPPVNQEALEFGLFYQFQKSSWGQGYATEAAKWLIAFMKKKYHTVTLLADVVVDNVASEKILQHIGFTQYSEEWLDRNNTKIKIHNYHLITKEDKR